MRAPQPPQQQRAKRTRRQLLAAARRVFADGGYDGASVDDIVVAAGCSKGAYYFHFATKEEILLALLEEWVTLRSAQLDEAAGGERTPGASLQALLDAFLAVDFGDVRDPRLLLEFWTQAERNGTVSRALVEAERAWRAQLVDAFQRAREGGDTSLRASPEPAADLAMATYYGLLVQACLRGPGRAAARERAREALAQLTGAKALQAAG